MAILTARLAKFNPYYDYAPYALLAISPTQVSTITEAVMEKIIEWQYRPLDEVYISIYLDSIAVKIRKDKCVINKAVYVVPGINMKGLKE